MDWTPDQIKGLLEYAGIAIAAGLIMLGGALGTALAQKAIGPAVTGAAAEDKSFRGFGILLLAFPETILIICTGIAYLLIQKIQ